MWHEAGQESVGEEPAGQDFVLELELPTRYARYLHERSLEPEFSGLFSIKGMPGRPHLRSDDIQMGHYVLHYIQGMAAFDRVHADMPLPMPDLSRLALSAAVDVSALPPEFHVSEPGAA